MLAMPFGIFTLVRLSQCKNARFPMLATPSGMTTSPPGPMYFFKTPFSITKSACFFFAVRKLEKNGIRICFFLLVVEWEKCGFRAVALFVYADSIARPPAAICILLP